jgi:hypothetical protein
MKTSVLVVIYTSSFADNGGKGGELGSKGCHLRLLGTKMWAKIVYVVIFTD